MAFQRLGDIVHGDADLVAAGSDVVVRAGGAAVQLGAHRCQLLKELPAIRFVVHQRADEVGGRAGLGRVGHDDLIAEGFIQKILPMLRRFFFGHVLGVVGHAHNHQTRAAVEVVLVLIRGGHLFGFRGDIRFQNPLLLEGQIVGGVADPQQIRGNLSRLLLGSDFGLNLAGARLIVIHDDSRILGFKGFLDGNQLLFL